MEPKNLNSIQGFEIIWAKPAAKDWESEKKKRIQEIKNNHRIDSLLKNIELYCEKSVCYVVFIWC